MAVDELIASFVDRLDGLDRVADLAGRFAADRDVFRDQFVRLYGDRA